VTYLPDPSVVDVITFWTFQYQAEEPFALCIDFSGTATTYNEVQTRVDPPLYTSFSAYVCVLVLLDEDYGELWHALRSVSFALDLNCTEACVPPSCTNLMPGDLAIGSWDEGVTLSGTDCVGDYGDLVYVARLDLFWLGGEADILILDHPEYPRQVVGCDDEPYEYEVASHGGIWKEPASTPVEATSWGAIKALYRD